MDILKKALRALGLTPYIKRLLTFFYKNRSMRFPTFDSKINELIIPEYDYFRYSTMGLAIQRLLTEDISGSLAEVGVYKGDMSQFIHKIAPQRRFYLFDTFEGFPDKDLEAGIEDKRFRDVNLNFVLKNIRDQRNIVIKKGYVPDTLKGLEHETFAFVLLDLDLYNPTLSSLQFFYPRLTRGGYLVVHDYNNPESNWACRRSLNEFMKDKPEKIIEIADNWGTALFRKI